MSKLSELILYVASQSQDDPNFSAIKLNKILFAVDFIAYGVWGHPVTEISYIRQEHGPAPEPTAFLQIRDQLLEDERATLQTRFHFGKEQKRIIALDVPDMTVFTEEERTLIDDVVCELKGFNSTQLSEWTHNLLPWLQADNGEAIPFYTIFAFRKRPVSQAGLNWGEKRLKELRESGDVP